MEIFRQVPPNCTKTDKLSIASGIVVYFGGTATQRECVPEGGPGAPDKDLDLVLIGEIEAYLQSFDAPAG